jgi:hypothetical protein
MECGNKYQINMKLISAKNHQNHVPLAIITAHNFTPLSAPQSKPMPAPSQYLYDVTHAP